VLLRDDAGIFWFINLVALDAGVAIGMPFVAVAIFDTADDGGVWGVVFSVNELRLLLSEHFSSSNEVSSFDTFCLML
jgi:hypothetical protein